MQASPAEMDIMEIAGEHDLVVVEDAAQGLGLHIVAPILAQSVPWHFESFHETKNIISGEGELY